MQHVHFALVGLWATIRCCPHSRTQISESSIIWNISGSDARGKRELEGFKVVIKYFVSYATFAHIPGARLVIWPYPNRRRMDKSNLPWARKRGIQDRMSIKSLPPKAEIYSIIYIIM